MVIRTLTALGAMVVLVGLGGSVLTYGAAGQARAGDRGAQYGGSLDARQHGYEHAYRDGADRGRQDRDRGTGYAFRNNDYQVGARDYEGAFGDKNQYMTGYREGYKAGYDDGYNDRTGQYGQLYGRPADSPQERTGGDAYAARSWGSAHMAFDVGYRDGITMGQQDEGRNMRSNFRGTTAYQNADLGYRPSSGDRETYRMQFRDGFERGYQDGYGRSRYSSDGGGYFPAPGTTGAVDTRDGQGEPSRAISVTGNRQWTSTNIRVNQYETLRFDANGEVHFTPNPDGLAGAAGSRDRKLVPGAPLPAALAGALIGRIDNGQPFVVGDQASIRMPASGILYLGINDDNVSDNTGQFQVVVSW